VERLECPGLRDRVVATEQQLALAPDRVAEVLELEPVGVGQRDLDALDRSITADIDSRGDAVPWIVEKQRALAADHLELVADGHRGSAVEEADDVARKAEHAREDPIRTGRSEPRVAVHLFGLAAEETRPADRVAADVHQGAAV